MNKIKFLLCFALLVSGVEGRGQIYINSYRFGGGNLLLDQYPTASAAYSLRKLNTAYTGNCLVIRRASGSPALDTVGFVSDFLDTARIKTFCSGTTCTVRVWYDQSGNARDASQETDGLQPTIYSAGKIFYQGSLPAIDFDGTDDKLINTAISISQPITSFWVGKLDVKSNTAFWDSDVSATRYFNGMISATDSFNISYGTTGGGAIALQIAILHNTNRNLFYAFGNGANSEFALNGAAVKTGDAGTNGLSGITIGDIRKDIAPYNLNGNMQELIIYATNRSGDKSNIESNINTFYSIY